MTGYELCVVRFRKTTATGDCTTYLRRRKWRRSRSYKGSELHKSSLGVFGSVLIARMLIIEGNVKFKGRMGFNTGSGI